VYVVWVVSLHAHEQPSPEVWEQLVDVVGAWDERELADLDTSLPFMRVAVVEDATTRDRLVEQLRGVAGAVVHVDPSNRLTSSDFAEADYVGVFAAPSDVDVVTNANEVLDAVGPCPACGLQDAFDVRQLGSFTLAEQPEDVDALNLPGGGLAVSQRVLDRWAAARVTGFTTVDLIDEQSGATSARWRQLVASKAVLVPCAEHTVVHGDPFCLVCGRAQGHVEGALWVRADQVEGLDVVARHAGRRAMFSLSRRARDALAGCEGIEPADVFLVCRH
jgi:hypothetical protein